MTNYDDTALAGGTTYYYVVSAVNAGGESTNSFQASATTLLAAGLTATAVSASQISLAWNAITNATSYNVKRSAVSGGPYSTIATGVTATNYTDTVPVGMKYYYVVSAVCGGVETPNSPEATVTLPYPWMTQDIGTVGIHGQCDLQQRRVHGDWRRRGHLEHGRRVPLCLSDRHRQLHHDCPRHLGAKH